eukprot:gnl/TRDRNA2_/TRDRNA2_81204_c0_seq1.p2 gnl/TRDRNA2_/TRDRNA2_81204_c0~~gnl/TRDRNA2_/TRDRNA2_81204_c0_seq1.p2  ORF type:complete len:128 (+),score=5.76 gnl/TRDRNA2_/TRDRNA2_81204_c0_seq1:256-639(+)
MHSCSEEKFPGNDTQSSHADEVRLRAVTAGYPSGGGGTPSCCDTPCCNTRDPHGVHRRVFCCCSGGTADEPLSLWNFLANDRDKPVDEELGDVGVGRLKIESILLLIFDMPAVDCTSVSPPVEAKDI